MAARVNGEEVLAIFDSSLTATQLAPFIAAATLTVDEQLSTPGLVTNTDLLKEIERWLAAHFAAMRDQLAADEGPDKVKYEILGEALMLTRYGQQAVALDPTGTLAGVSDTGRTALVYSVGAE